jgi:alkylation response protein AidB-like acyl-CoA dehydrogenase
MELTPSSFAVTRALRPRGHGSAPPAGGSHPVGRNRARSGGGWRFRRVDNTDAFRAEARAWLAEHRHLAPPNYGAIVPPELVDEGTAWQRRLFDAGMTGFDWAEGLGGRGLSRDHTAVWLEEAALADVPPFLNMVSLVLMGETVLARGAPEQAEHLPRSCGASACGASCSASPAPAATSRRSPPGPSATATCSW